MIMNVNQYILIFFLFLCKFDAAKLRKLRPSFKENGGSVTAGNASSIRLIYYLKSHSLCHESFLEELRINDLHTSLFHIFVNENVTNKEENKK